MSSSFQLFFTCFFHLYFLIFSEMLSVTVKEWKFCCIQFCFVLIFAYSIFSAFVVWQRKKYNFLFSYKLYTSG